ncbi:MAG: asparagine synthase (glutamine-hydrolyzing), partial [Betaproteobacteria bacterium]|nr:asparagine synthase (glutamine-hydrolyzing) [Betaproteobacteria bacterium]
MCGIAGILYADPAHPVDRAAMARMAAALAHRGPDGEGFHVEPGVGLAHRRLSIIDLASGQQPLCNEDGMVWITFNGEIFNYIELRAELVVRGHVFRTQSDTETLVHAYEEFGLDFVGHLNGQFAFALWDAKRRRMVLGRDRVGIRPLFHATLPDGTLLFASECKAIFAHGGLVPRIDPVAVAQIAALWVPVPPRTAFVGIEELAAGTLMVIEQGTRKVRRYWDLAFPDADAYEPDDLPVWEERVRETLADAVRLQLRADVPVASYLSGGLDSSILASLVKRQHNHNLITFSLGFEDAAFDERQYQRAMVGALGTDHREILVGAHDVGRAFFESVWWAERPLTRSAPAPLLDLAGLVRKNGIKVVLTGEGADEIFGGYNIFREDKVRRFWARQPDSAWRPALLSRLYGYVKRDARAEAMWRQFFRGDLEATGDPFYSHRIRWGNTGQMRRWFAPDFAAAMPTHDEILEEAAAALGGPNPNWHPLARAQ